jgi:hypothetical protein
MARQPAVQVFLKAFKSPFYRTVLTIPFSTRFLSRSSVYPWLRFLRTNFRVCQFGDAVGAGPV